MAVMLCYIYGMWVGGIWIKKGGYFILSIRRCGRQSGISTTSTYAFKIYLKQDWRCVNALCDTLALFRFLTPWH